MMAEALSPCSATVWVSLFFIDCAGKGMPDTDVKNVFLVGPGKAMLIQKKAYAQMPHLLWLECTKDERNEVIVTLKPSLLLHFGLQ